MTKHCGTCDKTIDDHKHVRYTSKGDYRWFCSVACVSASLVAP